VTTRTTPIRSRESGYTLLELAIATAILTIALGSLTLLGGRSAGALSASTSQSELDSHARRALTRISEELLPSGMSVLTPATLDKGAAEVGYRRSGGPVGGRNSWVEPRRFAFGYEVGELDDGLDNNGNGLVDEGVVTWTIDAGLATEHTLILCHGVRELGWREQQNGIDDDGDGLVDERGFSVRRSGDVLRLGLTLERLDAERHPIVRSLETTVQPRN
jgi:prepilin-type N-terminal cleavage/methylation domain-containing protein